MATLPDHPVLLLCIAAAAVYLWLAVFNPLVFAVAPSHVSATVPVATVPVATDYRRPAPIDIEPAPYWD